MYLIETSGTTDTCHGNLTQLIQVTIIVTITISIIIIIIIITIITRSVKAICDKFCSSKVAEKHRDCFIKL